MLKKFSGLCLFTSIISFGSLTLADDDSLPMKMFSEGSPEAAMERKPANLPLKDSNFLSRSEMQFLPKVDPVSQECLKDLKMNCSPQLDLKDPLMKRYVELSNAIHSRDDIQELLQMKAIDFGTSAGIQRSDQFHFADKKGWRISRSKLKTFLDANRKLNNEFVEIHRDLLRKQKIEVEVRTEIQTISTEISCPNEKDGDDLAKWGKGERYDRSGNIVSHSWRVPLDVALEKMTKSEPEKDLVLMENSGDQNSQKCYYGLSVGQISPSILRFIESTGDNELSNYFKNLQSTGTNLYFHIYPHPSTGTVASYFPRQKSIAIIYKEIIPVISSMSKPTMTMLHEAQHAELTTTSSWSKKAPYSIGLRAALNSQGEVIPLLEPTLKSSYQKGFSFQEIFAWQQQIYVFEIDRSRADGFSFGFPWLVSKNDNIKRALGYRKVSQALHRAASDELNNVLGKLHRSETLDLSAGSENENELVVTILLPLTKADHDFQKEKRKKELIVTMFKESFREDDWAKIESLISELIKNKNKPSVSLSNEVRQAINEGLKKHLEFSLKKLIEESKKVEAHITAHPL